MTRDRLSHDALAACLLLVGTLAAVGVAAVLAWTYPDEFDKFHPPQKQNRDLLVLVAAGVALLFQLYWHPYRALGVAAPALTAWLLLSGFGVLSGVWSGWPHGLLAGLALGGMLRFFRGLRPELWGVPTLSGLAAGAGVVLAAPHSTPTYAEARQVFGPVLLALLGLLTLVAWTRLFRPAYELAWEPPLWWMYAVRGAGPGVAAIPTRGPCLVLANHACYLDPLFLGKVLPRPITAMMTAKFADFWLLKWLAVTVYDIVRVPEKPMKHDPKEIQDAIERLDRGEALVVFPEGYLRRSEDVPLRRFGRGVWQILKARPDVPVFAVWIDGAWGSWMSYANGPPLKNKTRDFRRPIGVGVSAPVTVPADVLENHWRTRVFLMNEVAAARKHLGLPELPRYELPTKTEEEEAL